LFDKFLEVVLEIGIRLSWINTSPLGLLLLSWILILRPSFEPIVSQAFAKDSATDPDEKKDSTFVLITSWIYCSIGCKARKMSKAETVKGGEKNLFTPS